MFIATDLTTAEHIHNIINLRLFPECALRLGQSDHYAFRDARVVVERIGNPFHAGWEARSYRYHLAGPGFAAALMAIWSDEDATTASVQLISISPDDEASREAFREWLVENVDAKRPPPDSFAGLRLS